MMAEAGVPNSEQLDELMAKRAGWRHPEDFPESLFHYTSSTAFLNIIKSGELWFSDFRYMNDLSELNYGVELFKRILTERSDSEKDNDDSHILFVTLKELESAAPATDMFVFCMCEENNLLNQWRVYGKDTVPVSIEFATRGFMFVNWKPHDFEIVPMMYDADKQQSIASNVISAGLEYMRQHRKRIFASTQATKEFGEQFAAACIGWSSGMKHPQFAVEKEWRLAVRWGSGPRYLRGQNYRASPIGIIPYLTARPDDENMGSALPIKSVTIGPCAYPAIQRQTIHDLLYQHNMADKEVNVSDLPVRV
jgi:hypothetical protein